MGTALLMGLNGKYKAKAIPKHIKKVLSMKWVLALNGLPEKNVLVCARYKGDFCRFKVLPNGIIIVDGIRHSSMRILQKWFSGIEWLDESPEPDQSILWDEVMQHINDNYFGPPESSELREWLEKIYTLIRK